MTLYLNSGLACVYKIFLGPNKLECYITPHWKSFLGTITRYVCKLRRNYSVLKTALEPYEIASS